MTWKQNLKKLLPVELNAPMAAYTTYKAGGAAEVLALPQTEDQIKTLLGFALDNKLTLRVMGLGSNILVDDGGLPGITCSLRNFGGFVIRDTHVETQAGAALDNVVSAACKAGLGGLEGLSGIPGAVGGAVFMNAGAFNQETFDTLESFKIMTRGGRVQTLKKADVKYGYRKVDGIGDAIILSARWKLNKSDPHGLLIRRLEVLEARALKQPLEYPSAGSVFKRPPDGYASKIIDECGLRGLSVGGAQVSQKHAGFIVNTGGATAADIKNLVALVQKRVFDKTGIRLEREQIFWP